MINIATIGTSWITEQFLQACRLTHLYHIKAIYSRSVDMAEDFATIYKADYYTDNLNTIFFDPEIDLIYIASPNSLHFEQARRALKAGKHLIIEKPMVENVKQWHELHRLAEKMNVFIFEAALHIHNRNYQRMKSLVNNKLKESEQPFLGANFNIGQYSSRYLNYLEALQQGETVPNVFNPLMAGGALMDLGIYPLYIALDLFGMPTSLAYRPQMGANQVDVCGHIDLNYDSFNVHIFVSKATHSQLMSEIYIDDETIVIHDISRINRVDLLSAHGEEATPISYTPANPMYDELVSFAEVVNKPEDQHLGFVYESWKQLSLQVTQTLELLRQSAHISMPGDK